MPDVQISYQAALDAMADTLVQVGGFTERYARQRAAEALAACLTPEQREALQEHAQSDTEIRP
jgi:Spy/CpxP family protein refolding chaperone